MHNRRKRALISDVEQAKTTGDASGASTAYTRLMWGLIALGFTSVYREGFEVALFLQNLRMHRWGRASSCRACWLACSSPPLSPR